MQQDVLHRYPFDGDIVEAPVRADAPVALEYFVLLVIVRTSVVLFSAVSHFITRYRFLADDLILGHREVRIHCPKVVWSLSAEIINVLADT